MMKRLKKESRERGFVILVYGGVEAASPDNILYLSRSSKYDEILVTPSLWYADVLEKRADAIAKCDWLRSNGVLCLHHGAEAFLTLDAHHEVPGEKEPVKA